MWAKNQEWFIVFFWHSNTSNFEPAENLLETTTPLGTHSQLIHTIRFQDPTLLYLSQLERNLQKSRDAQVKEKLLFWPS